VRFEFAICLSILTHSGRNRIRAVVGVREY
jgi:hypothetical protein